MYYQWKKIKWKVLSKRTRRFILIKYDAIKRHIPIDKDSSVGVNYLHLQYLMQQRDCMILADQGTFI